MADQTSGLIVVVDDDPDLTMLVDRYLSLAGYRVETFGDAESCLAGFARLMPDAICLDLNLPGLDGLATLDRIRQREPHLPVIILTADREVDTIVAAVHGGAYDYLTKPIDRTKLLTTVKNAVERSRMQVRLNTLEREAKGQTYPGIVGRSAPMLELFRQMDRAATSDITVLVLGESGSGKELVARALHEKGGRAAGPFVALNCAAVPETLQESEFFGHERGAFTGATERRRGRFEQADGGTLFLDEVGELSPALQAKLLRVLQEHTFQRLGSTTDIRSDFRLIAATHRDLSADVAAGRFREDLFFRIAVFELEVPSLRARPDDIPLLTSVFIKRFARMHNASAPVPEMAAPVLDVLMRYDWPGNVRELSNAVQRAVVAAGDRPITVADLPPRIMASRTRAGETPVAVTPTLPAAGPSAPVWPAPSAPAVGGSDLAAIERQAIEQAIERNRGNMAAVVRELGIGRTTLYRRLKEYGIQPRR